jgi:hypothetical protein
MEQRQEGDPGLEQVVTGSPDGKTVVQMPAALYDWAVAVTEDLKALRNYQRVFFVWLYIIWVIVVFDVVHRYLGPK